MIAKFIQRSNNRDLSTMMQALGACMLDILTKSTSGLEGDGKAGHQTTVPLSETQNFA
ncbi:hypothetical protein ALTERO38_60360 [Alteromonas sp. 38]|nr:hypothetical protein ALTER154_40434 [Alteromonas sp. 154]VXC19025.1 hypothetical protein ALTERO38_60360 [Alteromonas sp. 38]